METYSGKTRVELTPLGWVYVASRALKQASATKNKLKKVKLEREGARAISYASGMLGNPVSRDKTQLSY